MYHCTCSSSSNGLGPLLLASCLERLACFVRDTKHSQFGAVLKLHMPQLEWDVFMP